MTINFKELLEKKEAETSYLDRKEKYKKESEEIKEMLIKSMFEELAKRKMTMPEYIEFTDRLTKSPKKYNLPQFIYDLFGEEYLLSVGWTEKAFNNYRLKKEV